MSLFWSLEKPQVPLLFAGHNLSYPTVAILVLEDSLEPRNVVRTRSVSVLLVHFLGHVTEVCNAVIGAIAIDVVNFIFRE